jgi:hypothetical protein
MLASNVNENDKPIGCIWRDGGSDSEDGSCDDFKCDDYSHEDFSKEDCYDKNPKNVSGGCFWNGDDGSEVCIEINSISNCDEIMDRVNCILTRADDHIFTELKEKCEWVEINDKEECVIRESVTDCGMYTNEEDCNGRSFFGLDETETEIELGSMTSY